MTKQITRQQLSAALVERHGQERQQHLYTCLLYTSDAADE